LFQMYQGEEKQRIHGYFSAKWNVAV